MSNAYESTISYGILKLYFSSTDICVVVVNVFLSLVCCNFNKQSNMTRCEFTI